jgi:hypothetical protein
VRNDYTPPMFQHKIRSHRVVYRSALYGIYGNSVFVGDCANTSPLRSLLPASYSSRYLEQILLLIVNVVEEKCANPDCGTFDAFRSATR